MAETKQTTVKKEGENKNLPSKKSEQFKALEKNISDAVLTRIGELQEASAIDLPKDYSAANALRTGWLVLLETNDRNGKPVLETCTKPSIANALQKMILLGLNPAKKQCDFIAYGNKLTLQMEYHGTIALAKRYGGVKKPAANIIYEDDEFEFEVDPETGYKKIIKHAQKFTNIDMNKIKGAYCVLTFEDGNQPYVEIMTMPQIRQAWNQGATKGNSPAHKNFPDEMAKKTVINRACKLFITSTDDGALFDDDQPQKDRIKYESEAEIADKNATEDIDFDDVSESPENTPEQPKKQDPQEPPKQNEPEKANNEPPSPGRMF